MMFSQWHITEAMIRYGGSFVQGLGRLFRQADRDNQGRLLKAFPEYFERYTVIAREKESELEGSDHQGRGRTVRKSRTGEAMKPGTLFPLGDTPRGWYALAPGQRGALEHNSRIQTTGEMRPPRKNEWYISGAIPVGYLAPNDFTQAYWIGRLVKVKVTTTVTVEVEP